MQQYSPSILSWGLILCFTLGLVACQESTQPASMDPPAAPAFQSTATGLQFRQLRAGTGPQASAGQEALIHETTRLKDGTMVTDTWSMNFPIRFLLGGNQVIDGMDQAVQAMRVGEWQELIVPPSLSRRTTYPDAFGPEDTLYYEVVLLQLSDPTN
ncbi:MAG: FKBP-type peptidyl-prolyl cis-trans isomerase [Bacteroidota bacterium]